MVFPYVVFTYFLRLLLAASLVISPSLKARMNLLTKLFFSLSLLFLLNYTSFAQDLSQGLILNDLDPHPMQPIAKPGYLDTIVDPSFGTTIRRITDAGPGNIIAPMYSTIQAWNADESLMIVYEVGGQHRLLNGQTYTFMRTLDDVNPADVEQIFWDFEQPDVFYYLERNTYKFTSYQVSTRIKTVLADLTTLPLNCTEYAMGNDVQMMSWDSRVFGFRCDDASTYYFDLDAGSFRALSVSTVGTTAAMPAPSGDRFYHRSVVYGPDGQFDFQLNENGVEHSCLGKLSDGSDAHFAISFEEGPNGGCQADVVAHDLTTGECFPITGQVNGYEYPKSGTHISALAHKNENDGWLAASMIGFQEDGQRLLDQELIIARAVKGAPEVYRIGHHRSDENEFDYWGEPHAVISPTGTRVLFGSDWSGAEDGQSVDCYVVELPAFSVGDSTSSITEVSPIRLSPKLVDGRLYVSLPTNLSTAQLQLFDAAGRVVLSRRIRDGEGAEVRALPTGVYIVRVEEREFKGIGKIVIGR